MLIKKLGDR